MLKAVGGEGWESREMNGPQSLNLNASQLTLAPSPVSLKPLDPKQNLKPKPFRIPVLKNIRSTKEKRKKEELLFESVLSFTKTQLNPSSEVAPDSLHGGGHFSGSISQNWSDPEVYKLRDHRNSLTQLIPACVRNGPLFPTNSQ